MIIKSKNNFIFQIIAVKKDENKIHFKHLGGSTECGLKLDEKKLTIDNIEDIDTLIGILRDPNLCNKCKNRILESMNTWEFYFKSNSFDKKLRELN